jgi:hypothetical protein
MRPFGERRLTRHSLSRLRPGRPRLRDAGGRVVKGAVHSELEEPPQALSAKIVVGGFVIRLRQPRNWNPSVLADFQHLLDEQYVHIIDAIGDADSGCA